MSASEERRRQRFGMGQRREICGEDNPGFSLWTSAHGFHHYSLSKSVLWRCCWFVLVLICAVALICCVTYYFYYVFSTSVYSRIIMEAPSSRQLPKIIICDKEAFRASRMSQAPPLNNLHTSFLAYSLGGELAKPDAVENDTRMSNIRSVIETKVEEIKFNGNYDTLIRDLTPTCEEFILECQFKSTNVLTGAECCGEYFGSEPIINQYGTCYSTAGGKQALVTSQAGENNGLRVVTMHESAITFESSIAPDIILGTRGVNFAIVEPHTSALTALRTRGQSAHLGTEVRVGISRVLVDNQDLEFSLIGRMECTGLGDWAVDDDHLTGLDTDGSGYTRENCQTAKSELLVRTLVNCTFETTNSTGGFSRCSPDQATTYYRSFVDQNNTGTNNIQVVNVTDDVRQRYRKECPQQCQVDTYSVTISSGDISDSFKADVNSRLPDSATSINDFIIFNFYLNSLEYQRIHNFPQHGMQFIAEVGGLMAFFLGISVISVLECFCYFCFCVRNRCCAFCCDDDDGITEDLPPPKGRGGVVGVDRNDYHRNIDPDLEYSGVNRRNRPDLSKFNERDRY